MMVTEKDVFSAMLDAAEAKTNNEANYRLRSKQFGMPSHKDDLEKTETDLEKKTTNYKEEK